MDELKEIYLPHETDQELSEIGARNGMTKLEAFRVLMNTHPDKKVCSRSMCINFIYRSRSHCFEHTSILDEVL